MAILQMSLNFGLNATHRFGVFASFWKGNMENGKKNLALDNVWYSVLAPTLKNSQIVFDSLRVFSTEVARSQCTLTVKFREVK